jgi:hypothetical protein
VAIVKSERLSAKRNKKRIGSIFVSGKNQSFRDQAPKAMFKRTDSGVSFGVVDSSLDANARGGWHAVRLDCECPHGRRSGAQRGRRVMGREGPFGELGHLA